MEFVGLGVDATGVLAVLLGAEFATYRYIKDVLCEDARSYQAYRHDLGRAILIGLELLLAADIIRNVAVSPTLDNVLVLALIALIRTF